MLLGYSQLQILEVFKNMLPNRLYLVLFPIDDLRLAVETAKRILTKEKINRQLSGHSGTMIPFMMVSEGYNKTTSKKAVSFNMQDRLDEKLDKLTSVMSKLTTKVVKQDKQFKPQIYQRKRRGQTRHDYNKSN